MSNYSENKKDILLIIFDSIKNVLASALQKITRMDTPVREASSTSAPLYLLIP